MINLVVAEKSNARWLRVFLLWLVRMLLVLKKCFGLFLLIEPVIKIIVDSIDEGLEWRLVLHIGSMLYQLLIWHIDFNYLTTIYFLIKLIIA